MKIKVSSVCDIGKKRAQNQDTVLVYQDTAHNFALFLVADGMGGYADGDQASGAIAAGVQRWLEQTDLRRFSGSAVSMMNALRSQLQEIHEYIWKTWNNDQVCGSTCTLLFLLEGAFGVFHVGDSRVYLSRRFLCSPLTQDDVWENLKGVVEQFPGERAKVHPNYGKLVHAVGSEPVLSYSVQTKSLQNGDIFALCSDGVYKMCSARYLKGQINSCGWRELDAVKDDIMRQVYRSGAKDNASLILVKYFE